MASHMDSALFSKDIHMNILLSSSYVMRGGLKYFWAELINLFSQPAFVLSKNNIYVSNNSSDKQNNWTLFFCVEKIRNDFDRF